MSEKETSEETKKFMMALIDYRAISAYSISKEKAKILRLAVSDPEKDILLLQMQNGDKTISEFNAKKISSTSQVKTNNFLSFVYIGVIMLGLLVGIIILIRRKFVNINPTSL